MTSEPKRRSGRATLREVVQLADPSAGMGTLFTANALQWHNVSFIRPGGIVFRSRQSHDSVTGRFSFHHQSPRYLALIEEILTRRPDAFIRANQNFFLLRVTSLGAASVHSTCAMEQPS
jgi:hypothetical protein